jgi:phosphate transport system substrate-binding protein
MRHVYLVLNLKPGAELDSLHQEYIKFIFSKRGQQAVVEAGYVPVNPKIAQEQLAKVGLDDKAKRKDPKE